MIKTTFRYFMPRICVCGVFFYFWCTTEHKLLSVLATKWKYFTITFPRINMLRFCNQQRKIIRSSPWQRFSNYFFSTSWTENIRNQRKDVKSQALRWRSTCNSNNRVTDSRQQRATWKFLPTAQAGWGFISLEFWMFKLKVQSVLLIFT